MRSFVTAEKLRESVIEAFSLLDARFDLPEGDLLHRPAYDGAWTIAEHLEHVSLANHFLLLTIKKGCRTALKRSADPQLQEGESDLELLAPVAIPGAFDWLPPAHMIPTGKRDLLELRAELQMQRDECLRLVAGMPQGEGRRYSIRMSVHKLGRLDMYQWLYFLVQHVRYHLAFIASRLDS